MKFSKGILAVLAALVLLGAGAAVDKERLADALAAVDANLKTPAGKKYDEQFGGELFNKYQAGIKQCKGSASKVDPFDILLKLSGGGKVEEVLVYPETQFAMCSRDLLLTASFNIHMQFKR
jgi:hypothetical protein